MTKIIEPDIGGALTVIPALSKYFWGVIGGPKGPPPPPQQQQGASPIFFDSFESGDLNNPTTTTGGSWTNSVNVSVSNDRAYTGTYSLRFVFGPNAPDEDTWSEQRFALGTNLQEIWLEYYIYIPTNYFHRDAPGTDNNKWMWLWGDVYSATNTHGASTWPTGNGDSDLFADYGKNEGPVGPAYGDSPVVYNFITDAERGQWNHFRWHSKMATTADSEDGLMEIWWNGVLVAQDLSMDIFSSTANYINEGYLLGYSNSGFTDQTLIYIDDFAVYATDPGW